MDCGGELGEETPVVGQNAGEAAGDVDGGRWVVVED